MQPPQNILVFLPNWVGDVVMATPALRAIREHFRAARITYIGRKAALDVLAGTAWADATLAETSSRKGLLGFASTSLAVRSGKFDVAVLMPNSFRSAALARMGGGIGRVIGYDRDGRSCLLTDKLQPPRQGGKFLPQPMIDYYNALATRLGTPEPGRTMELPVTPDDMAAADAILRGAVAAPFAATPTKPETVVRPLVMLNPGASFGPSKLWPAERFAAVADALIQEFGVRIVVHAAPSEKDIATDVAKAMKHPPLINFAERTSSLGLLKAMLGHCDLLITNDTGARHIAAAMGSAVVTIFGSTDPTWAQIDYPRERLIRVSVPCSPCQKKICSQPPGATFHQCMQAVTVESVLAAARELLQDRPRREAQP